jgi:NTP pyrophosphatase (non-canonical NTP hydrolase)
MKVITIELTDDMDVYYDDIKQFVNLMIFKLHKNVHKGRWENIDIWDAFWMMQTESGELMKAIRERNIDEMYMEAADVANFAMILASILKERGDGDL